MTAAPLAHVSHWLVNVLYLVPLVIVVVMLGVVMVRDRRAEAAEADPQDEAAASPAGGEATAGEAPVDEHAAP